MQAMDMKRAFGERIHSARKAKRMTQANLAATLGVTAQAVSGWERGESMPDADKVPRIAEALDVHIHWLLTAAEGMARYYLEEISTPDQKKAVQRSLDAQMEESNKSRLLRGTQTPGIFDFPIFAAAEGGNGSIIVHTDVMEYVVRPGIVEGVPDAYGITIVGTSMIPAYREGDIALVHPRRPAERGTDVILYDHDHRTGDAKAMIKHLVTFNDRVWKLEQYNPVKTFTEHRADWPICHQVVGMYKRRR